MAWFRDSEPPPDGPPAVVAPTQLRGGFRLPPRGRYEADATVSQRRRMEQYGGRDHEMMDLLGREQAEYLIHHLEMEAREKEEANVWEEGRDFASRATLVFCGVVALILLGLMAWDFTHKQGRFAPKDAAVAPVEPSPSPADAPSPTRDPAVVARAFAEFKHEVVASQARAVRAHPSLGVAGSHFNVAFVARYQLLVRQHSPRLDSSDWPERLADECAVQLPAAYQ